MIDGQDIRQLSVLSEINKRRMKLNEFVIKKKKSYERWIDRSID